MSFPRSRENEQAQVHLKTSFPWSSARLGKHARWMCIDAGAVHAFVLLLSVGIGISNFSKESAEALRVWDCSPPSCLRLTWTAQNSFYIRSMSVYSFFTAKCEKGLVWKKDP